MGTNYYFNFHECKECGHSQDKIHIGKSSAGWYFQLHVTEELTSLEDWIALFYSGKGRIYDEIGGRVDAIDMIDYICNRGLKTQKTREELEKMAFTEGCLVGSNNLFRMRVTPGRCVGHGIGTWDLVQGEFS